MNSVAFEVVGPPPRWRRPLAPPPNTTIELVRLAESCAKARAAIELVDRALLATSRRCAEHRAESVAVRPAGVPIEYTGAGRILRVR